MNKAVLQSLVKIRDLDVRLMELEAERAKVPGEYALEQQAVDEHAARIAAEEASYKEARMTAQHAESDIKAQDDLIKRYNGQLSLAKSNKEYTAILAQINGAKVELQRAEEVGLVALEKVETWRAALAAQTTTRNALEAALTKAKSKVAGRIKDLDEEIAELRGRRAHHVAEVPAELVASYDHIRERREGLALVEVIGGTCQGCFVKITAQENVQLAQHDALVRCRSCARIMVLPN